MRHRILRSVVAVLLTSVVLMQASSPLAFDSERRFDEATENLLPEEQQENYIRQVDSPGTSVQSNTLTTIEDLEHMITNDPFVFMVDVDLSDRTRPLTPNEEETMRHDAVISYDRYIIKYKEDGRAAVHNSLHNKLATTEELTIESENALMQHNALTDDTLYEVDNHLQRGDILTDHQSHSRWELLILNEPIAPSELADMMRINNLGSKIEYIQPDFQIGINSLVSENNTAGFEPVREADNIDNEPEFDSTINEQNPAEETCLP